MGTVQVVGRALYWESRAWDYAYSLLGPPRLNL